MRHGLMITPMAKTGLISKDSMGCIDPYSGPLWVHRSALSRQPYRWDVTSVCRRTFGVNLSARGPDVIRVI